MSLHAHHCVASNFAYNAVLWLTRPAAALLSPLALCSTALQSTQSVVREAGKGSTHAHLLASLSHAHAGNRLVLMHPLRITNYADPALAVARASHRLAWRTSMLRLTV